MKKLAALIFVLLLAAPAALAGNLTVGGGLKAAPAPAAEPGPVDPLAGYGERVDPADPASVWFLRMIDTANDEIALTADGTAICQEYTIVNADGTSGQHVTTRLYLTDYGYVFDVVVEPEGYRLYAFEDDTYLCVDGAAPQRVSGGFTTDYPTTPDMFLNEYDPAETLVAVRAEGDGFCYLTESCDGVLCENVTGADLVYTGVRIYEKDEAGDYALTVYGSISLGEVPGLPQSVIDLLGQ